MISRARQSIRTSPVPPCVPVFAQRFWPDLGSGVQRSNASLLVVLLGALPVKIPVFQWLRRQQQRSNTKSLNLSYVHMRPRCMGRFCVLLRCCVAHSFYLFEKKEKYKATPQQHPSNSLPQWVLLKSANHLKNNKKGGFYGQG